MATLLIIFPGADDVAHELVGDEITIGRVADNTIQIVEDSISSHHAKLTRIEGGYRLTDLKSTNQTWVNGVSIREAELNGVCALRFGNVEGVFLPAVRGPLWVSAAKAGGEITAVRQALDEARRQNAELTSRLESKAKEAAPQQDGLQVLQRAHDELAAKLELATTERDTASKKLEQLAHELASAREQASSAVKARDAAGVDGRELAEQLDAQKQQNASLSQKLTEAEARSAQLTKADTEMRAEISDIRAQLDQFRADRDAAKQPMEQLQRDLAEFRALADSATNERDELRVMNQDSTNRLNKQQAKLQETEQQREELRQQCTQLSKELSKAKRLAETLERESERVRKIETELSQARAQLEVHDAQHTSWNKERQELLAVIRNHDDRAQTLESQLEQLRGASEQLNADFGNAQRDLEVLSGRWSSLIGELQRAKQIEQQVNQVLEGAAEFGSWLTRTPASGQTAPGELAKLSADSSNGKSVAALVTQPRPPTVKKRVTDAPLPPEPPHPLEPIEPRKMSINESEDTRVEMTFSALHALRVSIDRLANKVRDRAALNDLVGRARALKQEVAQSRAPSAAHQMTVAIEALAADLGTHPEDMDAEKLRTVQRATDALRLLLDREENAPDFARARICLISNDVRMVNAVKQASRLVKLDGPITHLAFGELDIIENQPCDLAVLDAESQGAGWLEVCAQVRGFPRQKRLPLIVLLAALPDAETRAALSGREDFARKPFNPFELATKILTAILKRRLEQKPSEAQFV